MDGENKYSGLVADLMPNIRCMQFSGHFLFNYCSSGSSTLFLRKIYSSCHLILITIQFISMVINLALNTSEVNELTSNTITVLFFLHCITKFTYFALNSKSFYRSMNIWNTSNTHPLFSESNDRYHRIALGKMRKLLLFAGFATLTTTVSWITITFFDESVALGLDKTTNETFKTEVPRLPIKGFYPGNPFSGTYYYTLFGYQIYYLIFSMMHANLMDVLFCSWLIFACEQLQHLKHIMKPLMELSASLDTFRPNSAALFKNLSANSNSRDLPLDTTGTFFFINIYFCQKVLNSNKQYIDNNKVLKQLKKTYIILNQIGTQSFVLHQLFKSLLVVPTQIQMVCLENKK